MPGSQQWRGFQLFSDDTKKRPLQRHRSDRKNGN